MYGEPRLQPYQDTHRQAFFTTGMVDIWAIALANLLFHVYFNYVRVDRYPLETGR